MGHPKGADTQNISIASFTKLNIDDKHFTDSVTNEALVNLDVNLNLLNELSYNLVDNNNTVS